MWGPVRLAGKTANVDLLWEKKRCYFAETVRKGTGGDRFLRAEICQKATGSCGQQQLHTMFAWDRLFSNQSLWQTHAAFISSTVLCPWSMASSSCVSVSCRCLHRQIPNESGSHNGRFVGKLKIKIWWTRTTESSSSPNRTSQESTWAGEQLTDRILKMDSIERRLHMIFLQGSASTDKATSYSASREGAKIQAFSAEALGMTHANGKQRAGWTTKKMKIHKGLGWEWKCYH